MSFDANYEDLAIFLSAMAPTIGVGLFVKLNLSTSMYLTNWLRVFYLLAVDIMLSLKSRYELKRVFWITDLLNNVLNNGDGVKPVVSVPSAISWSAPHPITLATVSKFFLNCLFLVTNSGNCFALVAFKRFPSTILIISSILKWRDFLFQYSRSQLFSKRSSNNSS